MRRMIVVTGFIASVVLVSVAAASAPGPSTMTGVYTAAQAADGKSIYDASCAVCHGPNLRGSFEVPPLTGRLIANWAGGSVGRLHTYVHNAMPIFAPGSLSPEDVSKVIAYILKTEGYPAGTKPLPSNNAALAKIRFVPLTPARLAAVDAGK